MSIRILIFDTETNGVPGNRYAPISQHKFYPAILQLSWGIYEIAETGRSLKTIEQSDHFLRLNPGIVWNAEAEAIHGITEESARNATITPTVAFRKFEIALKSVDIIIAHNLAFDKSAIRAAAYAEADHCEDAISLRHIWPDLSKVKEICTMILTQPLIKIPSPYYGPESGKFKAPKLDELYTWLFGHTFELIGDTLHSATSDVRCLSLCISRMIRRGIIILS